MKPKKLTFSAKVWCTLGLSAGLLTGQPVFASPVPLPVMHWPGYNSGEEPATTKKSKNAASSLRNNKVVKISPHIIQKSMQLVVKDNVAASFDFFVFDLQGTLVQHLKLKRKDRLKIAGLAKGKYIYRVFTGDEETTSGQFEIR